MGRFRTTIILVLILAGVPIAAAAMLYASQHNIQRQTYVIDSGKLQPTTP